MVRTRLTSSGLSTGGSLGLVDVPDFSRQIVATERDTQQKPHPGHDPNAVADAHTALDEIQLKSAHLVGRCRIGRAFEPGCEPLATGDVAALRVLPIAFRPALLAGVSRTLTNPATLNAVRDETILRGDGLSNASAKRPRFEAQAARESHQCDNENILDRYSHI
jgi:hypothetical protein